MLAMQLGAVFWPAIAEMESLTLLNVIGSLMVVAGSMTTALGSRAARMASPAAGPPAA
jgi:hypothetical protein